MKKTLCIEGMNCAHCAGAVDKALRAVGGISEVRVDLVGKTVAVEAADSVRDEALRGAVTKVGFTVTDIR